MEEEEKKSFERAWLAKFFIILGGNWVVYEWDCFMECVVYRLLRNLERFCGSFFPNWEIWFFVFHRGVRASVWGWPVGGLDLAWGRVCCPGKFSAGRFSAGETLQTGPVQWERGPASLVWCGQGLDWTRLDSAWSEPPESCQNLGRELGRELGRLQSSPRPDDPSHLQLSNIPTNVFYSK